MGAGFSGKERELPPAELAHCKFYPLLLKCLLLTSEVQATTPWDQDKKPPHKFDISENEDRAGFAALFSNHESLGVADRGAPGGVGRPPQAQ